MAALPQSYISRNDVVVAVAWLLSCDMHQRPKPGHAPPGTQSLASLMVDLPTNDLDGRLVKALIPEGWELCLLLCVCCSKAYWPRLLGAPRRG